MAAPGPDTPRRRGYPCSAGFLTHARLRRILTLGGHDLRLGRPGSGDDVLVWGRSPYARRGEWLASATGAALVRVEDAFLRSLFPGRAGDPPLGLVRDRTGIYFDASAPSDLETLLARHPLDDTALLDRARDAIARMRAGHLGKYSAVDRDLPAPDPGFVLIIDQTRGDAAIAHGGANADSFAEMLYTAAEDHPDATLLIKAHPETRAGHRPGHFDQATLPPKARIIDSPVSPWTLFDSARAVYTVTSTMGFEAILAGHRPVTFGVPFYAGWGLTDDRRPTPARRQRRLTAAQLAAAALILYPVWYDPYRDRLGKLEDVIGALEARARAWREDRAGYVAVGMRAWKRRHLKAQFGRFGPMRFTNEDRATADGRPVLVWAGREMDALKEACAAQGRPLYRVEDGFLRSRGLGADLVPPLSQVRDGRGIHYDPSRPSDLDHLITRAAALPAPQLRRAERLIDRLTALGLSKYNPGGSTPLPDVPEGAEVVLVPGQVEDDASILKGAGRVRDNATLLRTARDLHPEAFLIYKPHPDVVAGLRDGAIDPDLVGRFAGAVSDADPARLLSITTRVVTITSGLGFEALIRGIPVTTLGAPFYAGWGLTRDLGDVPPHRSARPSLAALVHAALIAYPRYTDPVTGLPCPVEVAVDRLVAGRTPGRPGLRALAKLQGWLAGHSWLWR